MKENKIGGLPMAEHILVGLSSAPSNARIIRTAATMANAFGGTFTALFVRTPNYEAMSEENKERLRQNTSLAQELGATIETVFGDDVSYQIAEYARLSGVTKIVVGRSAISKRRFFGKPTLTEKLTQIAPHIDIHIIPDASTDPGYRQKKARKRVNLRTTLRDWGISVGILALASGLAFLFSKVGFSEANIIAIYLLAVLLTAMVTSTRSSYVLSAIGSVLVFNFFFTYPQFSLRVYADGAPLTFLIMLIASLTVGTMTDRMKGQTKQSTQAAYRTNLLLETNQLLQKAQTDEEVLQACRTQVSKLLGRTASVLPGVVASTNKDTQRYPIKVQDRIYGTVIIEGAELERYAEGIIEVEGHTDNVPMNGYKYSDNDELSSARAISVFRYLMEHTTIDPVMIKHSGRGEYVPIADNSTPEGRALNRRVEIKIYNTLSTYK